MPVGSYIILSAGSKIAITVIPFTTLVVTAKENVGRKMEQK